MIYYVSREPTVSSDGLAGKYLVARCHSGCVVGWSSLKPSMPLIEVQKFAGRARELGYVVDTDGKLPERVDLRCEH